MRFDNKFLIYFVVCTFSSIWARTSHQSNTHLQKNRHYTHWSKWSRCVDCMQKRSRTCVDEKKCGDSRMYEERQCGKKRCRRKVKQKDQFHIVHLYKDGNLLSQQAPSRLWSRWSKWTPCSERTCRTKRVRYCRKPGRCRKMKEEQTGYCYNENTNCETYVLNMLDGRQYTPNHPIRQQSKCGRIFKKSRMFKIIGGNEAQKYKWPWHVAILNKYSEVFCGGTLIAPRWVLTASHCIRSYLRVRLNEHDLYATDGRELEMTISKMFQHPKFNHRTVDNDIALLQLPYTVNVPHACLPNKNPRPMEMCHVMGWGKLNVNDTYGTKRLHETELPIVDGRTCKAAYNHFLITHNMLCAGWPSGKSDTCAGDSGGGLMCPYRTNGRMAYSVQGITSFGFGCGLRHKYGIYTTVYNYLKWIKYITDIYT